MMTEMMQVMKNMSKADNGNEEVIDLSNAPKADGNSQSDKKRKPRKRSKRLGPGTAQNQNPHLAQSVSQMLPVMMAIPHPQNIYPDTGIMKEYQNYLALLAVSLGRCGLTTSMM